MFTSKDLVLTVSGNIFRKVVDLVVFIGFVVAIYFALDVPHDLPYWRLAAGAMVIALYGEVYGAIRRGLVEDLSKRRKL